MNTDLMYWLHDYDLHFGYFLPEDVHGCDYYLVAYWGENYAGDKWPRITQALADPQQFTEVFRGPVGGKILYKVNFR